VFLKRPEVAQLAVEALLRGYEKGLYDLRVFAVISNHIHVLKGTTARKANLILARTAQPFWQRESYNHWVRDELELERIVAYIENNPVKAGLVGQAFLYRWSSAWDGDIELKFAAAR